MTRLGCLFAVILPLLTGSTAAFASRPIGDPPVMGRVRTVGWEIQGLGSDSLEGTVTGTATIDASFARSGGNSLKCDSGAGNAQAFDTLAIPGVTGGVTDFARAYFYFDNLPTSQTVAVLRFAQASNLVSARLTTGGKLQLWDDNHAVQLGSDSDATIIAGQWYRIELSFTVTALGTNESAALQLDGVAVASVSNLSLGGTAATKVVCGWLATPGVNLVCHVDDFAVNDSVGATQNTWPGEGKVVLLKPVSDSQRGSWTGGAGGTTNLWEAVNNTPPIGVAGGSNTATIENIDTTPDNATDEYRASMTDYITAGIAVTDTITLCQALVDHGEDSGTGTKTGSFLILSNPAQSVADTFTFGDDVGAQGTWPSNWRTAWGAAQVSPSVTLGTSPVLRVRKTDAGSRVASVDFMGIYVEYVPGLPIAFLHPFMDGPATNTLLRM